MAMQPLTALKGLEGEAATSVLAAAALDSASILSTSGVQKTHRAQVGPVLAEVRERLKIQPNDDTQSAKAAIASFLSRALSDRTLAGRVPDDVLAHAGQAGHLPPSAYKVSWEAAELTVFRTLGVRKSTVEKALLEPDEVQHLFEDTEVTGDDIAFSLFLKRMPGNKLVGPHWLLVQTMRKGIVQMPLHAWWVHPSLVDLEKVASPKDMLLAFVEEFGKPFRLFGKLYPRFLDEEVFPKPIGSAANFELDVKMSQVPGGDHFHLTWAVRSRLEADHFRLGIIYVIDLAKYRLALKRIGAL